MSEIERYVAYYRMPAVGDTLYADSLSSQRQDVACFMAQPARVLVGEFTEVLCPTNEVETSPAFDLSLACCRELGARLICAGAPAGLDTAAQARAEHHNIAIVMVDGDGLRSRETQEPDQPETSAPYLPLPRRHSNPRPIPRSQSGKAGNSSKANRFAAAILPVIAQIQSSGAASLTEIANTLNARGVRTARGRRWYPTTVKNILNRRMED